MDLISIVLPTYNGSRYLRQSIDSIVAQTWENWELIIVDDASTDDTPKIIEEYAAKDARIQVIHHTENRKLPQSLNDGFEMATGRYLTWTSDDNWYLPEALEKMHQVLTAAETVVLVSAVMDYVDERGNKTGQTGERGEYSLYMGNCVGACFLYKREVMEKVGLYDPEMIYVEDYDYWLRIALEAGKIRFMQEVLYVYRQHENSLTGTKTEQIARQLERLMVKHWNQIVARLEHDPMILIQFYHRWSSCQSKEMREAVYRVLPVLRETEDLDENKRFLVYGAGTVGSRTAQKLGEKIAFFVDNDQKKVGQMKDGIEIISFERAKELSEGYNHMIAVSYGSAYEFMKQLSEGGIYNYCTAQRYFGD